MGKKHRLYTEKELQKVKSVELDIFKEIIRLCNIHNISYFTVGGTTLGAVRHNGFIPWDDDIDIGMLREDYERFLKIANDELGTQYYVHHFTLDKKTPQYFIKIRKRGTVFVEKTSKHIKPYNGIFVDIMPYDKLPKDIKLIKKYRRSINFWSQLYLGKLLWIVDCPNNKFKFWICSIIRSIMHILLIPVTRRYLFSKLDAAMKKYNNEPGLVYTSRGYKVFDSHLNDLFPTKKHSFENMEVMIPFNATKLLEQQYGNWKELPPEDKRINHSPEILVIN